MAKRLIKLSLILVVSLVALFFLLPTIAKWYVEKHSEAWTGRKITLGALHFNWFTGGLTIENFKIFEEHSTAIFFQAAELYINTEPWRALTGGYEALEATLQKPTLIVTQKGTHFNFDDLVTRFTAADTTKQKAITSEPVEYWIRNISINSGTVQYQNKGLGNEVKVINLNAGLPLLAWDDPQHAYNVQCSLDKGGDIKGQLNINIENLEYKLQYDMQSLNLDILYPYLKDYIRVGEMKGAISTGLTIYGNFNEPGAVAVKGITSLNDLSITDPNHEPLVAIGAFTVDVDTLNVKSDVYNLNSVSLVRPFLKFERFDDETNFSRLLDYSSSDTTATDSSEVSIESGNIFKLAASFIQELSEQYAISNYKADSVIVRDGNLIFNDYTLHRKFNYLLEGLVVKAERLNSNNQNLTFLVSATLNTSGKMKGELLVNPNGFRDMVINYTVEDLRISDFNPYADYYVAHPFLDGVCFYTTKSSVNNFFLKSENKLEIKKIIVGKKEKNSTAVNLPIRFAVALLRDVNGNIAVDIPVEGNLDDPKYRLGPIIWQIFKNLILKAAAAPGKLLAKKSGVDEKYLEGFIWEPLQTELNEEQMKSLDAVSKTLAVSPEMNIEFVKAYNVAKEMDQLALQESKKRFLFFNRRISSEEEVSPDEEHVVESLASRDSVFNAYLDKQIQSTTTVLSVFDKSKRLMGTVRLQSKLAKVYEKRMEAIQNYMTLKNVAETRFRVVDPKEQKEIPYEGTSRTVMNFYLEGDEPLE